MFEPDPHPQSPLTEPSAQVLGPGRARAQVFGGGAWGRRYRGDLSPETMPTTRASSNHLENEYNLPRTPAQASKCDQSPSQHWTLTADHQLANQLGHCVAVL